MKRILWLLLLLVIVIFGRKLFHTADVAQLQPVELIRISVQHKKMVVSTDTGASGSGATLQAAFEDLKRGAPGDIFLDTAEFIIVTAESKALVPELLRFLRPACRICEERGDTDLSAAAVFLNAHPPKISLMESLEETVALPLLLTEDGRMTLVS